MQLADPNRCAKEIEENVPIDPGVLEIKKQTTFEREQRSKALVLHAVEEVAKELYESIHSTLFKCFRHASCQLCNAKQRLGAMYSN